MMLSRKIWSSRQRKLLEIRRIVGASMLPLFRPESVVWATGLFGKLRPGDVVIVNHGGLEKIKRVEAVVEDQLFVLGDNAFASTDSRSFGWLDLNTVRAKVVWPRSYRESRSKFSMY